MFASLDAESGTTQGHMRIHIGCELTFELPQTTPMIATLHVHFSRASDLERPDHLVTNPAVSVEGYRDSFGNWCNRLVAPAGRFTLGDRCSHPRRRSAGSRGLECRATSSPAFADGYASVSARQPLLRDRRLVRRSLAAFQGDTARLAARSSCLRLCA